LPDCSAIVQLPHITYGSTINVAVEQVGPLQCILKVPGSNLGREIGNITFLVLFFSLSMQLHGRLPHTTNHRSIRPHVIYVPGNVFKKTKNNKNKKKGITSRLRQTWPCADQEGKSAIEGTAPLILKQATECKWMHPLNKVASASAENYHFIALHETEWWRAVVNEVMNLLSA